jgi:hypothetical protein
MATIIDANTGPVVGNDFVQAVTPFATKLRLSEALDLGMYLEPQACGELARVLEDMALKADLATALFKELKEEN